MELPWVHKKSITVVYKVFRRERIDDCYEDADMCIVESNLYVKASNGSVTIYPMRKVYKIAML